MDTLSYLHIYIYFNMGFFHIYYTLTQSLLYVIHAHRSSQHTDIKQEVHILLPVIITVHLATCSQHALFFNIL